MPAAGLEVIAPVDTCAINGTILQNVAEESSHYDCFSFARRIQWLSLKPNIKIDENKIMVKALESNHLNVAIQLFGTLRRTSSFYQEQLWIY